MKMERRLLILSLLSVFLLSLMLVQASAEVVTIYSDSASYDRWGNINSGSGERRCPISVNYEGHVFEDIWNSGSSKVECVLFNGFDLSSIPSNAVINSAILKIKAAPIDYVSNSPTGTIGVYSASNAQTPLSLINNANAGSDIDIDVTDSVNGNSEIGFLLSTYPYGKTIRQIGHGGGVANYYTYLSSIKPKLVIDYSIPPVIINCEYDSDCGENGFLGEPFCSNDDVFRLFRSYTCNFPGTSSSYCSHIDTPTFNINCGEDSCGSFGANYCKNDDVYHSRTCSNRGCELGGCFEEHVIDEQVVQVCGSDVCEEGVCVPAPECVENSDCENEQYYTCEGDELHRITEMYGCISESCVITGAGNILIENCEFGCANGECLSEEECINGDIQSCNTGELGICAAGTQTCESGSFGSCVRNDNPVTEICDDDLDNDCDGLTDNSDPNCVIVSCTQNSDCNDNLFCNGVESCVSGICHAGNTVDCSANNLLAIATCNNNPDNNPLTWDVFPGFSSTCNENTDSCTIGSVNLTHDFEIGKCGVECKVNSDCDSGEECNQYECEEENNNHHEDTNKGVSGHLTDLDSSLTAALFAKNEPIRLGESEDSIVNPPTAPTGISNLWLWILIILAILLVIIILLVLALR